MIFWMFIMGPTMGASFFPGMIRFGGMNHWFNCKKNRIIPGKKDVFDCGIQPHSTTISNCFDHRAGLCLKPMRWDEHNHFIRKEASLAAAKTFTISKRDISIIAHSINYSNQSISVWIIPRSVLVEHCWIIKLYQHLKTIFPTVLNK